MRIAPSTLVILLVLQLACAGCTSTTQAPVPAASPAPMTSVPAPAGYTDVTPAEAKDLFETEKDLVIIDVSPYYDQGHLPGAVSIPLDTLDQEIPTLDKMKPHLVYCHGDGPSITGAQKLVDAGFPTVYRLEGNYGAWVSAGYPVEK